MTILRFPEAFRFSSRLSESVPLRRCRLEECHGACCLHGVWLDPLECEDLRANSARISAFLKPGRGDPSHWFTDVQEAEPAFPSGVVIQSAVHPNPDHYGGTECVFLRADWKCALQAAADAAGLHPWRWKPFHCIVHPLTFDPDGSVTLAADKELLSEEGSCFRSAEGTSTVDSLLAEEIEFLRRFPLH